jgi:hypothetical protein
LEDMSINQSIQFTDEFFIQCNGYFLFTHVNPPKYYIISYLRPCGQFLPGKEEKGQLLKSQI